MIMISPLGELLDIDFFSKIGLLAVGIRAYFDHFVFFIPTLF